MSRRTNAPYKDRVEENGRVLIYGGRKLARNGLFVKAAIEAKKGQRNPEIVAVYGKIHVGIWAFNGFFRITDSWQEDDGPRSVFKFRLELAEDLDIEAAPTEVLPHSRIIPPAVKLEVWQRDKGQCVICGRLTNFTLIMTCHKMAPL